MGHWEQTARLILSGACSSCRCSAGSLSQRSGCGLLSACGVRVWGARTQVTREVTKTHKQSWTAAGMLDCGQLETNQTAGNTSAPRTRLFARVIGTERKQWCGWKWHLTSQRSHFVFDRGGSTQWVTARLRFAGPPRVRRAGVSKDGQKNDWFRSRSESLCYWNLKKHPPFLTSRNNGWEEQQKKESRSQA